MIKAEQVKCSPYVEIDDFNSFLFILNITLVSMPMHT